jgi:methanethiol S-methyltransferase
VLVFAWLGGVLFVVSLSWCVYFYAVVLGRPATSTGAAVPPAIAFDVALFSIFAIHHSLLARTGFKRAIARHLPQGAERSVYVWIASLLLLMMCWWWRPLPGLAYEIEWPWAWALHGVQIAGVVLTWRGAAIVDVLDLAGIRQARHETRPVEFRIVGPFRLIRHPIYFGWMLMVFGAPTMTMSRLLFASISSLYLVVAIPWEERSLVEAFGDRYRAYTRQVRWRLLPGVW